MIRGLSALRASWSIPSCSVVPNEKLSTTTSDARASALKCCRPSKLCRSRTALRFPRFQTRYPVCCANGSPRGGSMRMTSAPLSARNMVVIGPAMPWDRSRTRNCCECSSHITSPLHLLVGSTIALTMSQDLGGASRLPRWCVPTAPAPAACSPSVARVAQRDGSRTVVGLARSSAAARVLVGRQRCAASHEFRKFPGMGHMRAVTGVRDRE